MKKLSKLGGIVARLALVAMIAMSLASVVKAGGPASAPRSDNSNQAFIDLTFIGCVPFRVEASTKPVLIATGSGIIYELYATSGTAATAYSVGFDSNTIASKSGDNWPLGVTAASLPAGKAITPKVFTNESSGGSPTAALGAWTSRGRRFETGLVVANSDPGLIASGCYRNDSGSNPGP